MVVLPDLVAVPTVLPELSRNVCMFCACAVPVAKNSTATPVMNQRDILILNVFYYYLQSCVVGAEPPALFCAIRLLFGGGIGSRACAEEPMSAVSAFTDCRQRAAFIVNSPRVPQDREGITTTTAFINGFPLRRTPLAAILFWYFGRVHFRATIIGGLHPLLIPGIITGGISRLRNSN